MICLTCVYYRPQGQGQPISPTCAWKATPEQLEVLLSILPAPHASRMRIQYSPYQVEECAAFAREQRT